MSSARSAAQFFDRAAPRYSDLRERFFLRTLRRREEASIMRLLDPRPSEQILDAGCGSGYYLLRLRSAGATPLGVDISAGMVAQARALGLEARVADLESLSLGRRFDKVLCAGVLEFCPNPARVLSRLSTHLRSRGWIVILVPRRSPMGLGYALYHRSHGVTVRLFGMNELNDMASVGLSLSATELPTPMSIVAKLSPLVNQ